MIQHFQNFENSLNNYAENRFEYLIESLKNPDSLKLTNYSESTYDVEYNTIINNVKKVLTENPKRIAILCHRGDITDDELEIQNKELDETYFFNSNIKNELTNDIEYLKKFLK